MPEAMAASARRSRRFPSSTASIRAARVFVADLLDAETPDWDRRGDVLLATSELVTNAVEHGGTDFIGVDVAIDAGSVTVAVDSALTGSIGDPAMWVGPAAAGPNGRGLMIVRSVVDEVMVSDGDGRLVVRCLFRHDARTAIHV
jgi:anti-sigma regulatory factor (Ser/Thr protein kinase)